MASQLLRSLGNTLKLLTALVSEALDNLEICGDLISQADENEILERLLNYLKPLLLPDLRSKLHLPKLTLGQYISLIPMKVMIVWFEEAEKVVEEKYEKDEENIGDLRGQVYADSIFLYLRWNGNQWQFLRAFATI